MIYTKTKLKNGEVIRSAVTEENTFTRCTECGKEIQVSLQSPVLTKVKDPFNPVMLCAECTKKLMHSKTADAQRIRPLVYICSPYSGDVTANVKAARNYCRIAVDKGYIPIAPHLLYPQFMNDNDPKERRLGLAFGNALMDLCSELWVCGDHLSAGMEAEFDRAGAKGMTIKFIYEEGQHD